MIQDPIYRLSVPTASSASTVNEEETRVRFAPSPSGYLHIGNLRIALSNWLFSLQHAGKFILRYDDTDPERTKDIYIKAIFEDLAWFDIVIHEVFFQSRRFELYEHAIKHLKEKGLLYPCYESEQELLFRRKEQLSRKLPPIYGREALTKTAKDRKNFEIEGRRPHWRFLLPNFDNNIFELVRSLVCWNDLVRGPQSVDLSSVSDPILVREDGSYLYTLPSVVDDFDMGITHVLRGNDHITNTGVQIAICRALNAKTPTFGHINLLTTKSGESLSKRQDSLSVKKLRDEGIMPGAIASLAVLTGTCKNVVPCRTIEELSKHFKLSSFSKSPARFNPADLTILNRQLLNLLSAKDVLNFVNQQQKWHSLIPYKMKQKILISTDKQYDYLEEMFSPVIMTVMKKINFVKRWKKKVQTFHYLEEIAHDPNLLLIEQGNINTFWNAFNKNFVSLDDIFQWWKIVFDPQMHFYNLCVDEYTFLQQTVESLPDEPWYHDTWQKWVAALKTTTKRTGKDLFQPLRLAITGKKNGPEFAVLLPIIGKVVIISRLLFIGNKLKFS